MITNKERRNILAAREEDQLLHHHLIQEEEIKNIKNQKEEIQDQAKTLDQDQDKIIRDKNNKKLQDIKVLHYINNTKLKDLVECLSKMKMVA